MDIPIMMIRALVAAATALAHITLFSASSASAYYSFYDYSNYCNKQQCCWALNVNHWDIRNICYGCEGQDVCNLYTPRTPRPTPRPTKKPTNTNVAWRNDGWNNDGYGDRWSGVQKNYCCQTTGNCPIDTPVVTHRQWLDRAQGVGLKYCCQRSISSWQGDSWGGGGGWRGDSHGRSLQTLLPLCVNTDMPTSSPTLSPTVSAKPSSGPSLSPSGQPSSMPSGSPSSSSEPSSQPSLAPSESLQPSSHPSLAPSQSAKPSFGPSLSPSGQPSIIPSGSPSTSSEPSSQPSCAAPKIADGDICVGNAAACQGECCSADSENCRASTPPGRYCGIGTKAEVCPLPDQCIPSGGYCDNNSFCRAACCEGLNSRNCPNSTPQGRYCGSNVPCPSPP